MLVDALCQAGLSWHAHSEDHGLRFYGDTRQTIAQEGLCAKEGLLKRYLCASAADGRD